MTNVKHKNNQGFSIIELAVVIIIIGLIIGGILTGADLIKSAKRQEVIKEYGKFDAAFNNFVMKYNGLPGDMDKATLYWPTATNGNGDGRINDTGSFAATGEEHYAWQDLSLSGFLPGKYKGLGGNIDSIPKSKFGGYYRVFHQSAYYVSDNMISLNGLKNNIPEGVIFSLEDINDIEKIMDDGEAATGKVLGFNNVGGGCITRSGSHYIDIKGKEVVCKVSFLLENL